MNNRLIDLSYSVFSNKGVFSVLLGSGISRAAGIPTGWDICLDLIRQIAILEKIGNVSNLERWYIDYFKEEVDYSNILQKLSRSPEERINILRSYFEPNDDERANGMKVPTAAHYEIANLVQAGYIKVIVTTNFDRLMENALKDVGIEPTVISNPTHVESSMPLIHSRITVIKINGDYLDTNFLNLKSELSGYDTRISDLLSYIFENFGIITCGWSAKWDLALVESLRSSNKFRFSSFFLYTGAQSDELTTLCHHRRGVLVKITDANQAFTEIFENINGLESYLIENPLSSKVVLARIRKYLSKEEHVISLSNVVDNLVEDVYKKLNSIEVGSTDYSEVRRIFEYVSFQTEALLPILAEGGFWSKPYQTKVWIKALKRVGNPQEIKSSYSIWRHVSGWPLLLVRYSIGIACVASENWQLLKSTFGLKFQDRYNERAFVSTLSKTHIWRVIERDHLNGILEKKYKNPASEILFQKMRSVFQTTIPDEREFENLFDYYEYICCLVFCYEEPGDFPPIGRFAYREKYFIDSKMKEYEVLGLDFELIKGGLFSTKEDLEKSIEKVKETLSRERFW